LTFIDFRLICLPKDLTKAYCSVQGGVNQPGLMPLALERIVEMAEVRGSKVEVSFFEVYMDRCYDLLEPKEADITVLDDGHGRIQLRGLAQVIWHSLSVC
jgi:kinesin family protein 22